MKNLEEEFTGAYALMYKKYKSKISKAENKAGRNLEISEVIKLLEEFFVADNANIKAAKKIIEDTNKMLKITEV